MTYDHLDTDELEELKVSTMNEMHRHQEIIYELDAEYTAQRIELQTRRLNESKAAKEAEQVGEV